MSSARNHIANIYARFMSHVVTKPGDPLACWKWIGDTKGNGYGHMRFLGKNRTAHSLAYELFRGPVRAGLEVCHTCDNRSCVNPDHLWLGTRKDNMQDAKRKGRTKGPQRHLTREEVEHIADRLRAGLSPRQISNDMGIRYPTISAIRAGRSYSRITGFGGTQ